MVECEAGYNGGLTQKFHLEVYNSAVDHLQANFTTVDAPIFSISKLPPGTPFVLVIYASNEKGKSNSVALMGNTLPIRSEESGKCSCIFLGYLSLVLSLFAEDLGNEHIKVFKNSIKI